MKKFLDDLVNVFMIIGLVIVAFILTAFMFWPLVAVILVFCVLFWVFAPVVGWIILILMCIFIILYLSFNIFE